MLEPELPPNESQRLASLHNLYILDTPVEERFDRITRVATRLFDVPIALISLVDADRQWFKSHCGLSATETPRSVSFCGHAILGNEVFLVPDVQRDPRFWDNPLVTGCPYIRFYAGQPLAGPDGSKLGTLCIVDHRPRQMSLADLQVLRDLAVWAETELNSGGLNAEDRARFTNQLLSAANIFQQLSISLNSGQLIGKVATLLQSHYGFHSVQVFLLDATNDCLVMEAGSDEVGGDHHQQDCCITLHQQQCSVARAARDREIVIRKESGLEPNNQPPKTYYEIAVPLIGSSGLLGVMNLKDDRPYGYTPYDLDVFDILARHIATALENTCLFAFVFKASCV